MMHKEIDFSAGIRGEDIDRKWVTVWDIDGDGYIIDGRNYEDITKSSVRRLAELSHARKCVFDCTEGVNYRTGNDAGFITITII